MTLISFPGRPLFFYSLDPDNVFLVDIASYLGYLGNYRREVIFMGKATTNLLVKQMPADLHHKARIAAVTEGITLREFVIKALTAYLKKKGG